MKAFLVFCVSLLLTGCITADVYRPAIKITLTLRDERGHAIQGADVTLVAARPDSAEVQRLGPARTDAQGRCVITIPSTRMKYTGYRAVQAVRDPLQAAGISGLSLEFRLDGRTRQARMISESDGSFHFQAVTQPTSAPHSQTAEPVARANGLTLQ